MESGEAFHPVQLPESADISDMAHAATQRADGPPGSPCEQYTLPQWGSSVVMSRGGHTSVDAQIRGGWRWVSANGGRRVLVVNAPEWLCSTGAVSGGHPAWRGPNGCGPVSSSHSGPGWLVIMPLPPQQRQQHMLLGGEQAVYHEQATGYATSVSSFTHQYDGRGLKESVRSGSLQQLIDDWGDSNIEELEAFIDSYLDMVLKDSLESALAAEQNDPSSVSDGNSEKQMCVVDACHEVLTSIDRKLSKLGMLEKMQRDLEELKQTSEQSRTSNKQSSKQTTDCSIDSLSNKFEENT